MTYSRNITALSALTVFTVINFAASAGFSSGHQPSEVLPTDAPTIDWLITGANNGSLKLLNLPAGAVDKLKCPLCFHLDKMNNYGDIYQGEDLQPFPGD